MTQSGFALPGTYRLLAALKVRPEKPWARHDATQRSIGGRTKAPMRTASRFDHDRLEQPPPLEQGDVEERRLAEPQQVGRDEGDGIVRLERLGRRAIPPSA